MLNSNDRLLRAPPTTYGRPKHDHSTLTSDALDASDAVFRRTLLGVMKRLIWLWVKSPPENCIRIGRNMVSTISDNLLKFHSFLPCEFGRTCRSLNEFERWKATEFRQVLLYSGSVALKNVPKRMYENFLLLFVSIYFLASSYYWESHADYAHELLCVFVEQFGKIYGKNMLVYNVHGLVHLAADVKKFGPLDSFSAFPFESFLGRLKKLLHKPNHPLQQIIRRLSEKADIGFKTTCELRTVVKHKHSRGPLPELFSIYLQYRQVTYNNLVLSTKNGDSCCQAGSKIGLIRNILCDNSGLDVMLLVEPYKKSRIFFSKPLDSSIMNIYRVSEPCGHLIAVRLVYIKAKYVRLPFESDFVVIPLLHQFA